jgi:hypothetical protein
VLQNKGSNTWWSRPTHACRAMTFQSLSKDVLEPKWNLLWAPYRSLESAYENTQVIQILRWYSWVGTAAAQPCP